MKKTSFKILAEFFCPTVRFFQLFYSVRGIILQDPNHDGNLVEKSKKIFGLRTNSNWKLRLSVWFFLTTSKQNAWLENAASYKRKLSRASNAAH